MCGLAGLWAFDRDGEIGSMAESMAESMAARLVHRGPDGGGVWNDPETGFAMAHRRLAVIDLSEAGQQPMRSASGDWVVAYNGEIYNHPQLRRKLGSQGLAPDWRGHSDTETLLACIEAWGLERTLDAITGMFAFALWNRREQALYLARDRIGEKPLYYGWQRGCFVFGSELDALRAHPAFPAEVDRDALALLLGYGYIPAPHSIYQGIRKLPAGTWLRVDRSRREASPTAYWSLREVAQRGIAKPFVGSEQDALDELERRVGDAVRGQLLADVPLGCLLSGGVDSTLVVAFMQRESARPVRTFTIGFDERTHDESEHAKAVAAYLGAEHTELHLGGQDVLSLVPELPTLYDEPLADSSQLPTHLVMKLARQHVTVALSGDGGDEFFGGYRRYALAERLWGLVGWVPASLRTRIGARLAALPIGLVNRFAGPFARLADIALPGDKIHKLGRHLTQARDRESLYDSLLSIWPRDEGALVDGASPPDRLTSAVGGLQIEDPLARMMVLDGLTYLPDDILAKVDRAAMAVSLETRAPLLDRDIVEFAWRLPMRMKMRDGRGKYLLRRLLDRHIPRHLVERPKMGFGIPLDDWLRGPLREWAEALLAEDRLKREGYLDPVPIRAAWMRHCRGEALFGYRLWAVLMFQAWLEAQPLSTPRVVDAPRRWRGAASPGSLWNRAGTLRV